MYTYLYIYISIFIYIHSKLRKVPEPQKGPVQTSIGFWTARQMSLQASLSCELALAGQCRRPAAVGAPSETCFATKDRIEKY